MSALNSTRLREHSAFFLKDLRHRTTFTASIAILDGHDIVYIDRTRSFRRGQAGIDLNIRVGSRHPAYATAMGKILMAYIPSAEQRKLVSELTLSRQGPNTVGSKAALRSELVQIREECMAVNDEELAPCLVAIAVPVRGADREVVAAIGMAAHTSMISLEEMVSQMLPHLRTTAEDISGRLGYRRDTKGRSDR
jgi:IclR family pca regulon transcriptional regulator